MSRKKQENLRMEQHTEQVQHTFALLIGAYYAGLYGLTAPDLAGVSYALLGLLVLFYVKSHQPDHRSKAIIATMIVVLWGSYGLLRTTKVKTRTIHDLLAVCNADAETCQAASDLLTGLKLPATQWQEPPNRRARETGLAVLATGMTLLGGVYLYKPGKQGGKQGGKPAAPTASPRLACLALGVWVAWALWAMTSLSSHTIVDMAKRDMLYPAENGLPGMSAVSPVVAKMQLYVYAGLVAVASLALVPSHALPLLCYLYLFMGLYFLSNLYKVNRTLSAWARREQEDPRLPTYVCGTAFLGGSLLLTLIALSRREWWVGFPVVAAMAFGCWDTHMVERLQDAN